LPHRSPSRVRRRDRGRIAVAPAVVTRVYTETQSVSVRIFSETDTTSWDRVFPLGGAKFDYVRSEDNDWTPRLGGSGWRSVLSANFADGIVLLFAELQL
jgi:hypothetical protein